MASDKAREIEADAIEKTRKKDWSGARESFFKVLERDDLLPSDRAYTLVNIANTYQAENNHSVAIGIARQALEISESLEHSDRALRAVIVRTIIRPLGSHADWAGSNQGGRSRRATSGLVAELVSYDCPGHDYRARSKCGRRRR